MATAARPVFAVDHRTHRASGEFNIHMDHNLMYWHMVQVFRLIASRAAVERANKPGEARIDCYTIYERRDRDTDHLWFAEHRLRFSHDFGIEKTLTWFDEAGMASRWQQTYKPILNAKSHEFVSLPLSAQQQHNFDGSAVDRHTPVFVTVQVAHHVRGDGSPDIAKMKRQYTAFAFDTNTHRVGGPTADMMHFSAAGIPG